MALSTARPSLVVLVLAAEDVEPSSPSRLPVRKWHATISKVVRLTAKIPTEALSTSTARSTARQMEAARIAPAVSLAERSSQSRPQVKKPYSTASKVQTPTAKTRMPA